MKEIAGCAICTETYNRHIDAYGKVSREEYDALVKEAKNSDNYMMRYVEVFTRISEDDDGNLTARIETHCPRCKNKIVYEGAVVEVSDDNIE